MYPECTFPPFFNFLCSKTRITSSSNSTSNLEMNLETTVSYSGAMKRHTRMLVDNGSFQSRYYSWRHKYARGKWFASVALLFVVPPTYSWKMIRFSRATKCGATNILVEIGTLQSRY